MNKSIRNINANYVKNMNVVVAPVSDSPKMHSFSKTKHTRDGNSEESEQHRSRMNDNSVETIFQREMYKCAILHVGADFQFMKWILDGENLNGFVVQF